MNAWETVDDVDEVVVVAVVVEEAELVRRFWRRRIGRRCDAALTNILDRLSLARSYNVPVTSKPRMFEAVYNLSSIVWW